MNAAIPESFRTRFERDGVVFPIPVLSPEKFSRYLACFSEIEDLLGRSIKRMGNPALYFSWAYRLATEPPVLDAVEEIQVEVDEARATDVGLKAGEMHS